MDLALLQRIKQWHVNHRHDHPVEYHMWDAMLTLWLMGWIGWLPTFALDAVWAAPLCVVGIAAPTLYIAWRVRAHQRHKLRCDWVNTVR
jgi:hypothetical protein